MSSASQCWHKQLRTRLLLVLLFFGQAPAALAVDNPVLAEANRLAAKRMYGDAEKFYLQAIANPENSSTARHLFGRVLAIQGRYEEALAQYKLSMKTKTKDPELLNDIGVVLSVCGQHALGARFLHQALVLNPRFTGALNNLGVTLSRLEAYKQATKTFQDSLQLQAINVKIKVLKAQAEANISRSKDFDFGPPVTWQDIPDSLKTPVAEVKEPPKEDKSAVAAKPAEVPKPPEKTEDEKFLEEATPLFLEVKAEGFDKAQVYGSGLVQVGNKSDSADATQEVNFGAEKRIEISGEVILDLSGVGELQVGEAIVKAKSPDCLFSVNAESRGLTCYAGAFTASGWNSIEATRATGKVDLNVEKSKYVYGQDDSDVEARDCDQVTLVGQARGTLTGCQIVVMNDRARAVVSKCKKLTVLAKSRARATDCERIEEMDQAKVEVSKE